MPNPAPSTYFPSVSLSGANEIEFKTGDSGTPTFPDLSTAEANPLTGNIAKMAYAILKRIAERYASSSPQAQFMVTSNTALADDFPYHRRAISLTFVLQPSGTEEVRPEP